MDRFSPLLPLFDQNDHADKRKSFYLPLTGEKAQDEMRDPKDITINGKQLTDARQMLGTGYEPAAVIEQPRSRLVLRDGLGEEWTVAWVKLSTAFKPHIKNLRGAQLAVWLYISLSINEKGVAFPGIRTIAEDTGYSHQGVLDAIKDLEAKGYMKVRRGERRYNLYEPEFAAIGKVNEPSETVNSVDESSKLSQVLQPNESTFSPNESSGLDLNKKNKKELDLVDLELSKLPAMSLRKAVGEYFKLNVNWETKTARQWLEWAHGENITAEQIAQAAKTWQVDKQFNWTHPTLKGIFEKWQLLKDAAPVVSSTPIEEGKGFYV